MIRRLDHKVTGQAFIFSQSDEKHDNSIVSVGGANKHELPDLSDEWRKAISEAEFLLLQRSVPQPMNVLAAKYARAAGTKVLLDMGGADIPMDPELMENVDIVSPNNTELDRILDFEDGATLDEKVTTFMKRYPGTDMLFKRGADGATYFANKQNHHMDASIDDVEEGLYDLTERSAFNFDNYDGMELVDTTGAGDCFTAAFAVAQLEGKTIEHSLEFACKAAFLCVSKMGAGPSMPTRDELEEFFEK